ncbi:hypothetical protein FKM82_001584 [Ascaphus truei]
MVFVPKSRMADAARWLEPFAQIQDGRPRRQCFGDGVFIPGLSSMVVNSIRLLPFLTIRLIVCIMASSLSGMFPSQPPVPPPIPPGSATGLMATPPGPKNPNVTLVDELESSFEACFASLVSQDYVNGTDQEEIRTGVDQCVQKFLDVARQTECFFLQKRLQLSVQKPEQVIKEVNSSYSFLLYSTWELVHCSV